ncbi:actin-like ATPase domain-containing [Pyrrhoderma noxium]|uniref:Actin-like ATPase domain-containing n=1 Tax=Pyrrhoderma noxium TaxID=2282107 RepID=A0A286UV63_9AGAM|nr:actin-like ATPase domain-containing [Pyrrhoderma noxium]
MAQFTKMSAPNGSAPEATGKKMSTVVGINFGNTYASIAVITKEGLADCIANEDGERQIACAISFQGEELYIGNQAKPQLVKNAENTIINFRNLLGKKFSEIPKDQPIISAPVIQHPNQPDVAAYKVTVLQPAPTPLPAGSVKSSSNTPAASVLPTPRSEPIPAERILTVEEVTSIFLKSLVGSAEDFLGKKVDGAVIAVPSWFDDAARTALEAAAAEAGVKVLQLVDEAGAGSLVTVTTPVEGLDPDRIALLVDLGQSSLALSVLSLRHGLIYSVASSRRDDINTEQIDTKIIKFFAKEFTKKTKIPLTVCPAVENTDKRAEARFRLAIEHTKRTISASPGAATCSVESLKDGFDFTGAINRMRFDMESRSVYDAVVKASIDLLASAGLEPLHVDEIIYVGGSASLPGLDEAFFAKGFSEDMITPFTAGTVIGGEIAAEEDAHPELALAFKPESSHAQVHATAKAIGLILPSADAEAGELGGQWVLGVPRETPLPYRRIVQFDCDLGEGDSEKVVGLELWEVSESVKVTKIPPPPREPDEEDDEEFEEEDEEVREKTLVKDSQLGALRIVSKNHQKENGKIKTRLQVQFVVSNAGGVILSVAEVKKDGSLSEASTFSIPALH